MAFGLTYQQLKELNPCDEEFKSVVKALGGARKWSGNLITAQMARDAGVSFGNIVWAASALSRNDREIERRMRHWMADCAAHVLHIFEKTAPGDDRPCKAIKAARLYADGKISAAARDAAMDAARSAALAAARDAARDAAWAAALAAARDAARAAALAAALAAARDAARDAALAAALAAARDAARDAEETWQFDRLCAWLSDTPPEPIALPEPPKAQEEAA